MDVETFLPGYHTGRPNIWIQHMVDNSPHWECYRGVPPQGVTTDLREATAATVQWYLGLPSTGGGHEGGSTEGYGNLYIQTSE